jgi:hypothetical protein
MANEPQNNEMKLTAPGQATERRSLSRCSADIEAASMTKEPDRRPIWPDILLVMASLIVAATAVYGVPSMLWPHPRLALALCIAIGGLAAFGVIAGLGAAAETRRCRKQRYWVRFVNTEQLCYEERAPEGPIRSLSFECARAKLGRWQVLGWEVIMPAEAEWDSQLPAWVRGRRNEIMKLIVAAFGGGTLFRFRSAAEQGDEADEARAV